MRKTTGHRLAPAQHDRARRAQFAAYFVAHPRSRFSIGQTLPMCVDELRYVGQAELKRDLGNFTAALAGVEVPGAFLPANTPGTIEPWMANE